MSHWFRRIRRRVRDSRGIALITTLFIVFTLGMMLFAFGFMMQGEAGFASLNRNSTVALNLAEAGAQEAMKRLLTFGKAPGTSSFTNSLASSTASPGSSGTVTYQASVQNNPQLFPILSQATFAGVTRAIRVYVQSVYKPGVGNVIFGPSVTFQGNAQPITGDSYALGLVSFQQYQKSPPCAATATPTNLTSPQVMAGTTIGAGSGPNVTPPCGGPLNVGATPYTTECASGSLTEVAPTPCPGGGRTAIGGYTAPVNWHPMTPIGMTSVDFTAAATWVNANPGLATSFGLSLVHAQQNGTDVTYTPVAYTPSYWSGISGSNGKVLLITTSQPFCLNSSPAAVVLPSPPVTGTCPAGYKNYGNQDSGGAPHQNRYLDWGLVADDLTRPASQTFFQAPSCTAPCANPGYQNGIRYIPLLPSINVTGLACQQNVNPGTNVFDKVNAGDGISCPNPPTTTISSTSVTFSGTYSNPEALVIDNAGPTPQQVSIVGSLAGPGTCSSNFQTYNWGVILATADLSFSGNLVFTGFIYTPGNIFTSGTVVFNGGVFAGNLSSTGVEQVGSTGTVILCAGSAASLPQSPQFFNFQAVSWQDRPLNQP